ncbi:beta-glucosidase [Candidatus Atribacteria bacterium HGW-Atribacteria-1]|nr:MAG: beta-glucosidase [Candidatus Atribacteria bacterium HGW-Atribacteria-1]
MVRFKKNFIFGLATSSYQIEGAATEGGRSPSIWDTFCKTPGKVYEGHSGDVACDHYHRYKEDVGILKEIGVNSYRFSISWSRIFPEYGKYNPKGMEFYKKLIDELNRNDIKPTVTLYHWDLPMWAHDRGGWLNRDSVKWFKEYAIKVFEELNDSVKFWITHNEPFCASILGYSLGIHAPGHKNMREALIAAHHILFSHGAVVEAFREFGFEDSKIGIALNLTPSYSASDSKEDTEAAFRCDGLSNRWFLDPVFKASYPEDMKKVFVKLVGEFDFIKDGDLQKISIKNDFLGVNYYTRGLIKFFQDSKLSCQSVQGNLKKTAMGWEICPEGLYDLILRLRKEYTQVPIYITENGSAFDDVLSTEKRVNDVERIDYIKRHLIKIADLNEQGADIRGCYVWSLIDNFEWAYGYSKRFGIVYVDFKTQERILKDSALWYKDVIKNRLIK